MKFGVVTQMSAGRSVFLYMGQPRSYPESYGPSVPQMCAHDEKELLLVINFWM